jgi:hypothetical protein
MMSEEPYNLNPKTFVHAKPPNIYIYILKQIAAIPNG